MQKQILTLIILLFTTLVATAQTGTLRGVVYDDSNGETVPFAAIFVEETGGGTTTDLDGAYELTLEAGTYNIVISYLGYSDYKITDVVFVADKVEILDVRMKEEGEVLNEVVVTAKQARNSEVALATIKRRSTNLLDGRSSQAFERAGDGNAGEALQRVTGVSVEGGKHVYVRGLGDRYTKTILNGMDIPGLDPDRNSVEMDLFPTNLIDNILVYKSFTPDLPGDFTGGVVNVVTKDFPEDRYMKASVGVGYNPSMHFNSNYIRQERSGTDFLGMDNGSRRLRLSKGQNIPNPVARNGALEVYTRAFADNAGAIQERNNLNTSFSFSTGNQVKKGDVKLGYIGALNYKASSSLYENAEFNTFIYDEQNFPGQFRLINDKKISGPIASESTLLSAMLGGSMKFDNTRISLQALRLQNGISQAAQQFSVLSQSSSALLKRDILEYAQREVTNVNLSGKHLMKEGKLEINWKLSPTFIEVDEPDIRFTAFEQTPEGTFQIAPAVGADVSRTWRNLKEQNYSGKVDLEYNFTKEGGKTNKVKFGVLAQQKARDFGVQNYIFRINDQSDFTLNGDASNIFNSENIWNAQTNSGTYVRGGFEAANTFSAEQTIFSAYIMNEFELTDKLKAIYGVRAEKADNYYTGQNNAGTVVYNNAKVLDELNFLPALNLVYAATEMSNVRFAYSKTVARPTFKEKSIAQIQDRISGRTFIGNIDLEQTDIDNIDLRYETFQDRGQTISVSAFYKFFRNPIELESFSNLAPDNFQPKNIAETATVLGVELDAMKRLGFIADALENFTAGANVTVVQSAVERSNAENLPEGERMRPMVGQSPYIVNGSLGYNNPENGFEVNASYNVQGKRLFVAGFGSISDVYEQPFNSLNLKGSKKFGQDNRYKISFTIDNLLGDDKVKLYESFSGDTGVFEALQPQRTFSLSFSSNLL